MHLQNGSILCIWSRASSLSAVRVLGVGSVAGEKYGVIFGDTVELLVVDPV